MSDQPDDMRRTLNDAEWEWAKALHERWAAQCEAEGMSIPAEPLTSVLQAGAIGMSRLKEAEREAIEHAQAEVAQMERGGRKPS